MILAPGYDLCSLFYVSSFIHSFVELVDVSHSSGKSEVREIGGLGSCLNIFFATFSSQIIEFVVLCFKKMYYIYWYKNLIRETRAQ